MHTTYTRDPVYTWLGSVKLVGALAESSHSPLGSIDAQKYLVCCSYM